MAALTPEIVAVRAQGELVVLQMGNITATLEFNVAIEIATEMHEQARAAKAAAGDMSRRFRTAGTLHDAASDAKPVVSRFAPKLDSPLKARDIEVSTQPNGVINLRLGKTNVGFPYEAALTVSQWLRVNGKQAALNAGELSHWTELAGLKTA